MMETRYFNGGTVIEHREVLIDDRPKKVIKQIRSLSEGMLHPRVDFEREPCPYGGFDTIWIAVSGSVPERPQKAAEG